MFSQASRKASDPQLTSVARVPRRRRRSALPRPDRLRFRRALASLTVVALVSGFGLAAAAPSSAAQRAQSYIVVLKDGVVDAGAAAAAQQSAYGFTASKVYRNAVKGYSATMTASQAQRLQANPNVDFVTAGRTFQQPRDLGSAATQKTPFWRKRIAGTDSDVRKALDRGPDRINVNVAVIDSGIDATHPDLNVKGGVDCQSGSPVDVTPVDVLGHGTFVAGVIGARDNGQGVIGTAPGTPLWSVRVVDNAGLISEQSLICAIDWVTSTRTDDNEDNDIAVANISIAGGAPDTPNCGKGTDPMHYAICRSVRAGVTYAVAAGNESQDFANTVPATYDQVLTATAMGDFDGKAGGEAAPTCGPDDFSKYGQKDDQPAFFSNFATTSADKAHTVSGPGMCMLSTWPGGYNVSNGTSFASPAVAGSVALCISQNECTGSAEQVMADYLHATKSYTKRHNDYGFGGDPVHPIGSRYYGYLTQTTSF
ncbi:S8 family serine peptidase [Arthrobacter sp. ok362]|uniref:S8 family peptidase n=1 Tax=Arthrobacter sp. ok362 TaxID=1761745 RepID=UPI000881B9D2|nr:S8 family serine peptidase [Arthrobacter sp. ok362]SDK61804.1 Serine protease, subtilisin family [Arthrobacter sp. ok362]